MFRSITVFTVSVLLLVACSDQSAQPPVVSEAAKTAITLKPIPRGKQYPAARLAIDELQPTLAAGQVSFDFVVDGFKLGAQTDGAADKGLANSAEGQHIHLILNNDPYSAHYEPAFTKPLETGHYVMLAFLSRSWHESIKAPGAAVVTQFVVGEAEHTPVDLSAPHLLYSRPKGTYVGDDTRRVMLDFYLTNATLSEDGYKINASINGQAFTLTRWQPYVIEGLPMGEHQIRLELVDEAGNLVSSPFNPVERTITLKAQ